MIIQDKKKKRFHIDVAMRCISMNVQCTCGYTCINYFHTCLCVCQCACLSLFMYACLSVFMLELNWEVLPCLSLCRQLWVGGAWVEDAELPWAAEVSVSGA